MQDRRNRRTASVEIESMKESIGSAENELENKVEQSEGQRVETLHE